VRVSGEQELAARRREEGRRGEFGAALQRAESRRHEAGCAEAGRKAACADEGKRSERAAAGAGDGSAGAREATGRSALAPRCAAAWGQPGEPAPCGVVPPAPPPPGRPSEVEPGRAALVEAVRALPPVLETFGGAGREVLSIDFGGAIGAELRRAPGGVEVELSVPAALRPAARVELAALCRELASRGVTVVSAEVRAGAPDRRRAR